ncbi:MAG: hypothetical protein HQM13_02885 [SAR324 cluster bacterium]|nr:hypothetical protein [SAR324 cluster bacterium]
MTATQEHMSQEKKQQFAGLLLLDQIATEKEKIHSSFMEKNDQLLEEYLNILEKRELLEVAEDLYFKITEKGRKIYQQLLNQQISYDTHFDIYAYVDLEEGTFADKEADFLEDERWDDLRVAVARFKGIDPFRMVFLGMMSNEIFFENSDWKFDLAAGSLFEEMEAIVNDQIREEDLSYEDEEGFVSGHDVLDDIIAQGSKINQERYLKRQEQERAESQQAEEQERGETVTIIEEHPYGYDYGYNPMLTLGAYAGSVMFMEALWHDPYW